MGISRRAGDCRVTGFRNVYRFPPFTLLDAIKAGCLDISYDANFRLAFYQRLILRDAFSFPDIELCCRH